MGLCFFYGGIVQMLAGKIHSFSPISVGLFLIANQFS